ncbi:MAG: archaellin/type IV pilin N-terminal domain-containing protein [Promethearchaeota archaeon]
MRKTIHKLKRLMQSKKAVSPVIAVILLIAIAVAASVTVFAYTQGILGGVTQANLTMSNFQTVDSNTIAVTIQNTGGTSTTIDMVDLQDDGAAVDTGAVRNALTGQLYDNNGDGGTNTGLVVGAGSSVTIEVDRTGGSWTSGEVCTVQVWLDGDTTGSPAFEADFQIS